jgi:hypothetical protein
MRPDPNCERCRDAETMEHLLCECMHYSQLIRIHLGNIVILDLNSDSQVLIPRVEFSQLNVVSNVPHQMFHLYLPDKTHQKHLPHLE